MLGDSVTTDHIFPAGGIYPESPAGEYLRARRIERQDFSSYGSRRGNDEVMVCGQLRQRSAAELARAGPRRPLDGSSPDRRGHVDLRCGGRHGN